LSDEDKLAALERRLEALETGEVAVRNFVISQVGELRSRLLPADEAPIATSIVYDHPLSPRVGAKPPKPEADPKFEKMLGIYKTK